jgi:hypothetical protein
MLDPAVLATLLIGLDHHQTETPPARRRPSHAAPRPAHSGIRLALARGLRRAAGAMEPRTFVTVADEWGTP